MTENKEFDLQFWKISRNFFQQYKQQKSVIFRLFEELSNTFPKDFQKLYFNHSKGNKISQGYNLDGFPYQVLDLVRNFDRQNGFNIRILNWVGNGLYIFIYVGGGLTEDFLENNIRSKNFKNTFTGDNPFQYEKIIIESETNFKRLEYIKESNMTVFWEKIELNESFSDNLFFLRNKIEMAFDYTN